MRLNVYPVSQHKADELITAVRFAVNGHRAAEYLRPRYRHDR
jgi:hypothetical protein